MACKTGLTLAVVLVACIYHASCTDEQNALIAEASASHSSSVADSSIGDSRPTPPVWPEVFKSVMLQNRTNNLALVTLYYNFKQGYNLNLISSQLGKKGVIWDMEWNNGTSFIFSRDEPVCKTLTFEVGILTPDWLHDSKYLGQTATDNIVCDVWTKVKFINYYADKETSLPVRWTFLWTSAEFHTMEWVEGAALTQEQLQAPPYCFTNSSPDPSSSSSSILDNPIANGRLMRMITADQVEQEVQQRQQERLQLPNKLQPKLPTS